ncbi:FMRFamide-activated amiloride-sensitive sodium channel-like [Pecten maximus]|uniref:FMRFamide-activated amiloride-sensitive sodium channel-like n=1 Tax=Pecten maximus TaxID=6579 RepID=UPI0014585CE4|nr:FMRFamide-activated amiloride-sensitive sodium channel-like [Pecten maximus]
MVTNDRPRLRRTLREMAENSTIHGLPKIFQSKQTYLKIIWLVVFLATTGYVTYQLSKLFEAYFEWPIKTTVKLKYNPLQFPAVSFCNMNPIKRSYINYTSEEVLSILSPELATRNILNEADTMDDNITVPSIDSVSGSGIDYGQLGNLDENLKDINFLHDNGDLDPANYDNNYGNLPPDYLGNPFPGQYDFNFGNGYDDYGLHDYSDDIADPFRDIDDELIRELMAYDDTGAPREQWISRIEAFKDAFMNEPRENRYEMGHSIEDMLVSCSYNARKCFPEDFKLFQSSEYGNCFTLESSKYFSRKPGPLNGLWLTLNLEILEYITSFVTGYGIKLLIHQPGTVVFPTLEGIVLSPGHETSIALRMVNVKRLGPPYGECSKGEAFQKTFGIHYTIPACIKLCKHHWVIKKCGCVPKLDIEVAEDEDKHDESYYLYDDGVRDCDAKDRDDTRCQLTVESLYLKGSLDCSCGSPCEEIVYEKTISGRPWPNDIYLKYVLMKNMCQNKTLPYLKEFCSNFLNNSDATNISASRNNFLRTVIYYEDINYEVITESPLYDEFQFLSNIGGTLGLFLGASVISAVEIIHLFIETILYFRRRIHHRKKIKDSIKINVKPIPKKQEDEVEARF